MKYAPVKGLIGAGAAVLEPPVEVALSEWSEDNVRLSSEGSAAVGNPALFPYQGEPLNCMSPHSDYEQVCLMWASQMSKTQLSLCLLSYVIAETAGPCLYVMPTLSMAETFSKDRLAPALRDTPILRGAWRTRSRATQGTQSCIADSTVVRCPSSAVIHPRGWLRGQSGTCGWMRSTLIPGERRQRGFTNRSCHRTHPNVLESEDRMRALLRLPMQA